MLDARRCGWTRLHSLRILGWGLIGFCLLGRSLPAAAQSWPGESGPTGDALGLTLRQFDRMDPPPIEATGRAERVVPNMPRMAPLPNGSVDVGLPVITSRAPAYRGSSRVSRPLRRQEARRRAPAVLPTTRASHGREKELSRELAGRDRQIRELQRQIEDSRRGAQESRGADSTLVGISPAAAATVTPR